MENDSKLDRRIDLDKLSKKEAEALILEYGDNEIEH